MHPLSFDVAIIGGGPGGSATAISLRKHAPSLSVVLIEATHYEAPRIGETLPPPARSILEHLGVWQAFQAQCHREVYGTMAAWGAAMPLDNDFIYMPANTGWHLDRAAFDRMLASQAENTGAAVLRGTRVKDAKRADRRWRLTLSSGSILSARFIVDATGGAASIARRHGARFADSDRLIGIARMFEDGRTDPRTVVEAFEDGWWYTAGLPDGRRVLVCMTDSDIARRMKLRNPRQWRDQLSAMPIIGEILSDSQPCGPIIVRSTQSRRLEPVVGEGWLAVGDCASRFDPLSSQGIVKAMRSGIFASYAIGDFLTGNDEADENDGINGNDGNVENERDDRRDGNDRNAGNDEKAQLVRASDCGSGGRDFKARSENAENDGSERNDQNSENAGSERTDQNSGNAGNERNDENDWIHRNDGGDGNDRNNESGLRRYRRYVNEEFRSYCEARAKYYRQEQRWPASEFWRRRHAPG
jgi:flavin-dependent dehydrogenase